MRILGLCFVLMLSYNAYSQVKLYAPDYGKDIATGSYKSKSFNFVVKKDTVTINSQLTIDSISLATGYVRSGMWLFNNSYPEEKKDVAGLLRESSLFTILEIEYRQIYDDPRLKKPISFEVWYKILLNGQIYYMDIKPSRLVFQQDYDAQAQIFTLFNLDSGYDYQYDGGYPTNFKVLVFEKNAKGLALTYHKDLDNFRNWDEFWEPVAGVKTTLTAKGLEFELIAEPDIYKATWNGKELVGITVKSVD